MEPVAVCAPVGRDNLIVLEILRSANIAGEQIEPDALASGVAASAYSAALLTQEAVMLLSPEAMDEALSSQAPWSDLPFVVLASRGSQPQRFVSMLDLLGNVVQVTRPVHPSALANLVRNALRARSRQLEARHYLDQSALAEAKLQDLALGLEQQVTMRTRELTASNQRLAAQEAQRVEAQARLSQLQNELIYVSRVSAMGAMASTLAHELNQPLTAVMNYLRGSLRLIEPSDIDALALDGLELALASAHRAGEIVRRLRELVSRGVVSRQPEDLAKLINEAIGVGLLDAAVHGATHRVCFDHGISKVMVDRVQIQQVLVNLLRNAVEAMVDAKTKEIVVSTGHLDVGTLEVSVTDSGPGLPPKIFDMLFSPLQTTKEGGMGLGLSICRTIIEANGGTISGENRPEGGAKFRFTLPGVIS